ncbi:MAG: YxeA family protein [Lachnospiraceae bacterium]|nr:YxeA family protein [Lachnospiraceae bacterium]
MKKNMTAGITAAAIIITGFICFCMWFLSGAGSTYYYAQIDNRKIEQVHSRGGVIDLHGGMDYSYTLPACDEDGTEKDITFGTSRELKEGAFIRLTVMPVRGVLEWSEVPYDELPSAVQSNFAAPAKE